MIIGHWTENMISDIVVIRNEEGTHDMIKEHIEQNELSEFQVPRNNQKTIEMFSVVLGYQQTIPN